MWCKALAGAKAVDTEPYSSRGLMYCLYRRSRVRVLAPQVRPKTRRKRFVCCRAMAALALQCVLIVDLLLKVMPSTVSCDWVGRVWPWSFSWIRCLDLELASRPKDTTCVFAGLSLTRHLEHQDWIRLRQRWSLTWFNTRVLLVVQAVMSSANWSALQPLQSWMAESITHLPVKQEVKCSTPCLVRLWLCLLGA